MKFNINGSTGTASAYCFRPGIIPDKEEKAQEKAENNAKPWEKKTEKAQEQAETVEEMPEEIEEELEVNDGFAVDERQKITPVRQIMGVLSGVGYIVAVGLLLCNGPMKPIYTLVCLASALFVAGDPLQLVTLFIAPQTRAVTAINIILWCILVYVPDIRYLAVIITVTALSCLACIPLNGRWLYCSRVLRTNAVMHSCVKSKENEAFITWQQFGKRETRTAYLEANLDFSEKVLNSYGLAGFYIGFYAAYKRLVKIRHELEATREELEEEQDRRRDIVFDKSDAERRAEEAEQRANTADRETKRISNRLAEELNKNRLLTAEVEQLKEKLSRRSSQEPTEATETSEPLRAGIEAEADAIREAKAQQEAAEQEKTREYVEKIKEMLRQTDENGACIFGGPASIGKHLGISKYYAKKFIVIASAELEAENAA